MHRLPMQLCPSRHGGMQTDGAVASGSAAAARGAPPTAINAVTDSSSQSRPRIPRPPGVEPASMVSQAGYDCPPVSLRAPIAVPVEIRAPARRVFRLATNVGEDGIRLARGATFEAGRPVDVRFDLPDGGTLALAAVVGEGDAEDDELAFVDPPADARTAIRRYVHGRLGMPG